MASFIWGLNKSKKHQLLKDITARQMGITEGSAENVTEEDVKEDNKQLQLKVQKNEKLIQKLHLEQSEHENVLKVKEHAKKRNMELLAEQKRLVNTATQLEHEAEKLFGGQIKQATARIQAIETELEELRQESIELENDIRTAHEGDVGQQYFEIDKTVLERMIQQAKIELESMMEKLDQLKTARARRGRVYNSVEEFMAERAMIIDLAMTRGSMVQVKEEENAKLKKTLTEREKTAADLQKKLDRLILL